MDELVTGTSQLPVLREGRRSGVDEDGRPARRDVVDGSCERLRSTVDVHEYRRRLASYLSVALCGGEGDHLSGRVTVRSVVRRGGEIMRDDGVVIAGREEERRDGKEEDEEKKRETSVLGGPSTSTKQRTA